jgi:CubicO group peptidase (beta-lactamase class C family)
MVDLASLRDELAEVQASMSGSVGGSVVGVAVGEEQVSVAHGCANLNTGQPFTTDTGFLIGSVTKVLTTTLVLRLVERGLVDLDASVTDYLPDFRLATDGLAKRITVRMLLNHSNGLEAHTMAPTAVRGRDAARSYEQRLAETGTVFDPGSAVHYSNPGFVLAGRVAEEVTGLPFERAVAQEVFGPCGMADATAVQTEAFLRRTAIGARGNPDGTLRATELFTLPESMGPCGSTPIATVADMIAFGRTHLRAGVSPTGERVLSAELVQAMQTPTIDMHTPATPPMGLGWWLAPIAGTVVPSHGGGSPGGNHWFCIVPEHDAVIVSFATGPGAGAVNDALHATVLRHLTGNDVGLPFEPGPSEVDPDELVGTYTAYQHKAVVERGEGDTLVVSRRDIDWDDEHRELFRRQWGAVETAFPPLVLKPVGRRLYAPAALPLEALGGLGGRFNLHSFLPPADGHDAGFYFAMLFHPLEARS